MLRRSFLPVVLLLLGCSSYKLQEAKNPALEPWGESPEGAARICIVRTSVLAQAVAFPTRDNGKLVGATRGPSHFCYLAEPGPHEIEVEADSKARIALHAVAGRTYFVEQEVENLFGYVTTELTFLDLEAARDALASTPYEVLEEVPKDEKLPEQPPFAKARHVR